MEVLTTYEPFVSRLSKPLVFTVNALMTLWDQLNMNYSLPASQDQDGRRCSDCQAPRGKVPASYPGNLILTFYYSLPVSFCCKQRQLSWLVSEPAQVDDVNPSIWAQSLCAELQLQLQEEIMRSGLCYTINMCYNDIYLNVKSLLMSVFLLQLILLMISELCCSFSFSIAPKISMDLLPLLFLKHILSVIIKDI